MGVLVDEASCECSTSSLEWFDVLPTQTSIAKSTWRGIPTHRFPFA